MHVAILETRVLRWPDETACAAWAQALAHRVSQRAAAGEGVLIELTGTLGAGKTTFVRHLLRALGVAGRIKSPSYAIVEEYEVPGTPDPLAPLNIRHFDFYRFTDPREWEDAGFRELFAAPGLKLVEWPEHAAGLLPVPDLRLHLAIEPDEARTVRLDALSPLGKDLLA